MTLEAILLGMLPECHLPRWIDPDTGACEHPEHDYATLPDLLHDVRNYGGIY